MGEASMYIWEASADCPASLPPLHVRGLNGGYPVGCKALGCNTRGRKIDVRSAERGPTWLRTKGDNGDRKGRNMAARVPLASGNHWEYTA